MAFCAPTRLIPPAKVIYLVSPSFFCRTSRQRAGQSAEAAELIRAHQVRRKELPRGQQVALVPLLHLPLDCPPLAVQVAATAAAIKACPRLVGWSGR